jgi:hypothetical protein
MTDRPGWPQHLVDAACAGSATFERDRALYAVISRHGFRPVVFDTSEYEAARLAARLAGMFKFPALHADAETKAKLREEAKHAPLFRAIKQSSGR